MEDGKDPIQNIVGKEKESIGQTTAEFTLSFLFRLLSLLGQ